MCGKKKYFQKIMMKLRQKVKFRNKRMKTKEIKGLNVCKSISLLYRQKFPLESLTYHFIADFTVAPQKRRTKKSVLKEMDNYFYYF